MGIEQQQEGVYMHICTGGCVFAQDRTADQRLSCPAADQLRSEYQRLYRSALGSSSEVSAHFTAQCTADKQADELISAQLR